MEDRFKTRISFVTFQDLSSGKLHELLAVTDLYLDTLGYNGHTAAHDHLWANGVLVTVMGKSLASRIGADLLESFGTPENICDSPDAAVARVNFLLQKPGALKAARAKAEDCRSKATMYDNALRAQMVIEALVRAYREKLSEQKQVEVPCDLETLDMEKDQTRVTNFLESLGIALTGSATPSKDFTTMPATFRGVEVVVKITNQLNPHPQANVVFREVLGRDGQPAEFGAQAWPRLMPLVEISVDDQFPVLLDVIHFRIRGKSAFAVLVEQQASELGPILNDLCECWKLKPTPDTVNQTAGLLRAMVELVDWVHERKRSYGGEPRELKVSLLQDGFGKTAVAYFERPDKQVLSLLLGGAEGLMDPSVVNHFPDCEQSGAKASNLAPTARGRQPRQAVRTKGTHCQQGGHQSKADLASLQGQQLRQAVRQSARGTSSNASLPYLEVKARLALPGAQACGCIRRAQRDDLRRIATAITNAILGKKDQKTEVKEFEGLTSSGLVKRWLNGLSKPEFLNATGLLSRGETDEGALYIGMQENKEYLARFKALFEQLANMLGGGEDLEVSDILKSEPFASMPPLRKAYPEGLDSVPEGRLRESMGKCTRIVKSPYPKTMHYWVAGRTLLNWNGRGLDRKLLATWLVLTWKDDEQRYYRSVLTAEAGKEGDFGAIYHVRLEWCEAFMSGDDKRFILKLPTNNNVRMDGTPRSLDAAPKAVQAGNVAQYVNSNLDELGDTICSANCTREWTPEWRTFSTKPFETQLRADPSILSMALRLTCELKPYQELFYNYYWGKFEREAGSASTSANIFADFIEAGAPQRVKNQGKRRRSTSCGGSNRACH
jgi:hypothetical protein